MKWLHKHVESGLPHPGVITDVLFIDAPELSLLRAGLNKHLCGTGTCAHAQIDALLNVSSGPDLTSPDDPDWRTGQVQRACC